MKAVALAAALALSLGLVLGGCNFNIPSEQQSSPAPSLPTDFLAQSQCAPVSYASAAPLAFSRTVVVPHFSLTTSAEGFTRVTAEIPDEALSVGVVLRGPNSTLQLLDHGVLVLSQTPNCLTTPLGPAPLAFNRINVDQDAEEDIDQDLLLDRQTEALFYPNDGAVLALPAGTYSFPVASADLDGALTAAQVDVDVFYKVAATQPSEMRVNLWVVQGTGGGIDGLQTQIEVEADPNLFDAESVLNNVYGESVGLQLTVRRILLADVPALLIIDSEAELDALFTDYPSPAENTALNVFVVDTIDLPGLTTGVIGLASRVPGPFNMDGTSKSGIVVEYLSSGTQLGYTIAHELGHYLGLFHTSQQYGSRIIGHDPVADTPECLDADLGTTHNFGQCPDAPNLMFPFVNNTSTPILSDGQVNVIRLNPAISTP